MSTALTTTSVTQKRY